MVSPALLVASRGSSLGISSVDPLICLYNFDLPPRHIRIDKTWVQMTRRIHSQHSMPIMTMRIARKDQEDG